MIRPAHLMPRAGPISSNNTLPHLFVYAYLPPFILSFALLLTLLLSICAFIHTYCSSDVLYIFVG